MLNRKKLGILLAYFLIHDNCTAHNVEKVVTHTSINLASIS